MIINKPLTELILKMLAFSNHAINYDADNKASFMESMSMKMYISWSLLHKVIEMKRLSFPFPREKLEA